MILGNGERGSDGARVTLDDLFRRAGVRHPDKAALADPPNREAVLGGAPRRLTYAQADRAISAFAARLRGLGLATDTVVGLQLPNTVESVVALLGVLRAGMIAAPLPLLWHRREIVAALGAAGAKAIVTAAGVGPHRPAEIALQAAAKLFPVRYVCGFGSRLPDGVVALDDVFAADAGTVATPPVRPGLAAAQAAAHVAAVTFEATRDGPLPIARNHGELIAGGLAVLRECGLAEDADLWSAIPLASFAGLAVTLLPWLLSGGTLHLHHGFDPPTYAAQCRELESATLVLPGPVVAPFGQARLLGAPVKTIVALWRAPERLAAAPAWQGEAALVDVSSFGETGLTAVLRGAPAAVTQLETTRTPAGTLALRGPMVPTEPFPPGATLPVDQSGFVDSGFACRQDDDVFVVSGPPAGMIGVGGYRFAIGDLEALVARADADATLVALPDALTGDRLAGSSADPNRLRVSLEEDGINPLIVNAFRPRSARNAA